METAVFYVMIIIVCIADPVCDFHTSGPRYFKYSRRLDRFFSLFSCLYRKEWRDSYHQICWHWLKWIRFYIPFIAYILVCDIFWIDVLIGALLGHFIWRAAYDYSKIKMESSK